MLEIELSYLNQSGAASIIGPGRRLEYKPRWRLEHHYYTTEYHGYTDNFSIARQN